MFHNETVHHGHSSLPSHLMEGVGKAGGECVLLTSLVGRPVRTLWQSNAGHVALGRLAGCQQWELFIIMQQAGQPSIPHAIDMLVGNGLAHKFGAGGEEQQLQVHGVRDQVVDAIIHGERGVTEWKLGGCRRRAGTWNLNRIITLTYSTCMHTLTAQKGHNHPNNNSKTHNTNHGGGGGGWLGKMVAQQDRS